MPKLSGIGQALYVGGRDVSGDIGSIGSISSSRAVQDVTGIDKYAMERLSLLADGELSFSAFLNAATDQAHDAFKALPDADTQMMYFMSTTLGAPVGALQAKRIDYAPTRGNDGSITIAINGMSNGDAIEWCRSLTAGKRTDTGGTVASSGTSIDLNGIGGTTLDFGAVAYLQVFSFTGTDATVDLQDSADNSSFATITSMSFAQVTGAIVTERVESPLTGTIRRHISVATTTSGGFTSLIFAVGFMRRETAGY